VRAPIEVTVDGQPRGSSVGGVPVWSYDSYGNAVTFEPDQAPGPGSSTEIRYTVLCR
jgi:hypothetical protein